MSGFGQPHWGKVALAGVVILAVGGAVALRVHRFRALDELHQRMELEAFAAAFGGSFVVFFSYWLFELAGLLPPLHGMYYLLGMVALIGVGSESAWCRLARKPVQP